MTSSGLRINRPTHDRGGSAVPLVSVLVPTYQGHEWIAGCLDSLAGQTLPRDQFEVVVLQNGPQTGTDQVVADWQARHPGFPLRYLEIDGSGEAHARNRAIEEARGRFLTFVDDDDRVGPGYLAALTSTTDDAVITGVYVAEVFDSAFDRPSFNHDYTRVMASHRDHDGDGTPLNIMLGSVWAKLLSTRIARETRFNEDLVLGCDTDFMCRYAAAHDVTLRVVGADAASAYLLQRRVGSMMSHGDRISRADVAHRLNVLRALEAIEPRTELGRVAIDGHTYGQWLNFLRDYATQSPEARDEIEEAVIGIGLREQHWRLLRTPQEQVTHELAWPVIEETLDVIARAKGRADGLWEANIRPYLQWVPDDLRLVTAAATKRRITAPWDRTPNLTGVDLSRAQISAVIPCYEAAPFIVGCLDSFAAQSIVPRAFELVLVLNGPDDGTADLITDWSRSHPEIQVRVLESGRTGAAAARNVGLAAVTTPYVTFVDSDDTVRPQYLASLLAELGPGVIAAVLEEEHQDGRLETLTFNHAVGVQGICAAARRADLEEVAWYLRPVWAKAVSTEDARAIGFPEDMATEEDTLFWFRLYAQGQHRLQVGTGGVESAYVYRVRRGSLVARGEARTWESTVPSALVTLTRLAELRGSVRFEKTRDEHLRILACDRYFGELLRDHPDLLPELRAELERAGLGALDLRDALRQMPRELAMVGGETGAAALSTASIPAAVDALTFDGGEMGAPATLADRLVTHGHVGGVTGEWGELRQLLDAGLTTISAIQPASGYTGIRTASAEPLVDLLAAILRAENPEVRWTAVRIPRQRERPVVPDALFDRLTSELVRRGYPHDTVPETTGEFADLVVEWLADEKVDLPSQRRSGLTVV